MSGKNKAGWTVVVAVNVVAIAAVLGLAELGVRWLVNSSAGDEQLPMCRPDDHTIWRYRPNVALTYRAPEFEMAVRTNEEGLRSSAGSPDGRPTVLFVGDSFTFGWGVAEGQRFSEVVAEHLGDRMGNVRIVNAGHWMYSFDQQLVLLKALVQRHRPAVVVQGFYWLHVRTLFNHTLRRDPAGALRAVEAPSLQVDGRGVLRFHSDWIDDPPLGSQALALAARGILNRDLRRQAATWVDYMLPGSSRDAGLWAMTDDLVGETIAFLREAGVAYVPFLVPSSVEVGGTGWSHVGWQGREPPSGIDVTLPARRLAAVFEKRDIHAVVLTESLKARGGPALYYSQDGHWTERGHKAVGENLAPAVATALNRAP